jgi:hypothetical protein
MKIQRIFVVFLLVMIGSVLTFGQTKTSKGASDSVQAQLETIEKQAWEAWKNKNGEFFQAMLTEDSINVGAGGVDNKAAVIKFTSGPMCDIKSYSLDSFQVVMTDKKTAILTYKAMQDGTCDGKSIPAAVWAATMFVKRGNKWVSSFHQETPVQP